MSNGAMHYDSPQLTYTPEDWELVRQQEAYEPHVVPVNVKGITVVRELPAKAGRGHTYNVPLPTDPNGPKEIIPADPRIRNAFILTPTSNPGSIVMGTLEQVKAATPDGFTIPNGVFIGPFQGFDEPVFAVALTGTTNTVSLRYEYWAD